ncbi:MAG: DUF167 domain-containing protein [Candidatus Verstraetearchaeota archaeon]|nr:DUF167 domain-containing protein [Candidatus Verstraetearchaeota archaeon]
MGIAVYAHPAVELMPCMAVFFGYVEGDSAVSAPAELADLFFLKFIAGSFQFAVDSEILCALSHPVNEIVRFPPSAIPTTAHNITIDTSSLMFFKISKISTLQLRKPIYSQMSPRESMKEIQEGLLVDLLVKPGSRRDLLSFEGELLVVETKERAERNKANLSVVRILSKSLGVPTTSILILKGRASKNKSILIKGINEKSFVAIKSQLAKTVRDAKTTQDNLKYQ